MVEFDVVHDNSTVDEEKIKEQLEPKSPMKVQYANAKHCQLCYTVF